MNYFTIDFAPSCDMKPLPQNVWQQSIIDFIELYSKSELIPVHTSGSTGNPKEILLYKSAMQQSARLTARFLNLKMGDSALLCLPMDYIAGKMMVVRAIEIGMKLICVQPKTEIQLFDKIDFGAMTPMQAENSISSVQKIKKLILGGAQVSHDLELKLKNINSQIYETYGMTETITHIAMRQLNQQDYFQVLEKMQIRQDDRGCLVIKTPYFQDEIITNDLVEIKSQNTFHLIGRVDNIINSGGIKINPESVEEKLQPYIQQPFIIHYKTDVRLGQKLVLVIESQNQFDIEFPKNVLPKKHRPKEIFFLEKFPRTASGKIQRNKIKL